MYIGQRFVVLQWPVYKKVKNRKGCMISLPQSILFQGLFIWLFHLLFRLRLIDAELHGHIDARTVTLHTNTSTHEFIYIHKHCVYHQFLLPIHRIHIMDIILPLTHAYNVIFFTSFTFIDKTSRWNTRTTKCIVSRLKFYQAEWTWHLL